MEFEERQKRKAEKRKELEKKMKGKFRRSIPSKHKISTGTYILDKALHDGFVRGRIHEVFAPESGGKTLLATQVASQVNKINNSTGEFDISYQDPQSVWVGDMENTYDPDWARVWNFDVDKHGNDCDFLSGGDTACDVVADLINDDAYAMYILDCTDQFYPLTVMEGEYELNDIGLRAKALARCMRKWLTALAAAEKRHEDEPWKVPFIVLLSHGKEKFMQTPPKIISDAGKAVRFYSSIRIRLSQNKIEKAGTDKFGVGKMTATVVKNKVTGAAGYVVEYFVQLADSKGIKAGTIDNAKAIFADLDDFEIMKRLKKGYQIDDVVYDKQDDIKDKLRDDPEFMNEMWKRCAAAIANGGRDVNLEVHEDEIENE